MPLTARTVLSIAALALLPWASARAQVVVLDEGTFTLSSDGARVGREDFSIRRATTADLGYVAQGNVLRGDARTAVALTTDSVGAPQRFKFERFVGGRLVENVSGEFRRGLWSGRAVRMGTESGREFRLPDVVLAAERGVVHETWFLVRFGQRPGVRLLEPRTLSVVGLVVEAAGADTVTLGFDRIPAQRWLVRESNGGAVEREAWVDAKGRLLRVLLPKERIEAVRDEAPVETVPPA